MVNPQAKEAVDVEDQDQKLLSPLSTVCTRKDHC
jgi:hypothetical protein